jgi:hypothetical protein
MKSKKAELAVVLVLLLLILLILMLMPPHMLSRSRVAAGFPFSHRFRKG